MIPFGKKLKTGLLQALMYYLWYEAPPYEQTLSMVADMLTYADVREDDETHESPLVYAVCGTGRKEP
jgi:type IV secretion system protein VirD4